MSMLNHFFNYKPEVLALDEKAMELCQPYFRHMEEIRDFNQLKMLKAFADTQMSSTDMLGTTGYGLWDTGRAKLEQIFAEVMGADLVVGSLIKNPGGGIAPTGGYIAGRKDLVELCAYRLNAPGLGKDLGCTLETPRDMYLGFYYAPGVVCEAIKTAIYAQCMLELLGKNPVPRYCDDHNDIVTCFDAGTADALIGFCQGIQAASPVDSYAAPETSPEPGYTDEVVMASGSFTQGSTIELSCDGPLREPYTCYLQGGLNFAASRAGVLLAIQKAYFKG